MPEEREEGGTWLVFENGKDLDRVRWPEGDCRPRVRRRGAHLLVGVQHLFHHDASLMREAG